MKSTNIHKFNIPCILLSVAFLNGCGDTNITSCMDTNNSPKENFSSCLSDAEDGNATSQFIVSGMYRSGQGIKPEPKLALQWAIKSAENGYTHAYSTLGSMYASGIGNDVPINYDEAIKWYKKDLEQGNYSAESAIDRIQATIAKEKENEKIKMAKAEEKAKEAKIKNFLNSLTTASNNSYIFELKCDGGFGSNADLRDCFHTTDIIAKKDDATIKLENVQIQSKYEKIYLSDDSSLDFKVSGFGVNLSVVIKDPNNKVLFNERLKEGEGIHAENKEGQFNHSLTR